MKFSSLKTRNSRWDHSPILDGRGRPKTAVLTARDIEGIFRPLARHRYLPADYLHAFAGGSLDYLIDRLALLSRGPNLYLSRPQRQRANAAANHRRLIYELADKGIWELRERGISYEHGRAPASFEHELMVSLVSASFALGTREGRARLIRWCDILDSKSLPDSTRRLPKPYAIPVSTIIDGQAVGTYIAADGPPFGVERIIDGRRSYFFCPGIEADCGTEPIQAADFARSSISKKLVLYLAVVAQGIHRSHFGFPNLYVPIVTTNAARVASMMKLLERITAGVGSRHILFKTFPSLMSSGKPLPPSGAMMTEDWQRVGYPSFNFLTS
jgi:hypothetical protein